MPELCPANQISKDDCNKSHKPQQINLSHPHFAYTQGQAQAVHTIFPNLPCLAGPGRDFRWRDSQPARAGKDQFSISI